MAFGVSKRVEGFSHRVSSGLLCPILGWSLSPSFTCKMPSLHVLPHVAHVALGGKVSWYDFSVTP